MEMIHTKYTMDLRTCGLMFDRDNYSYLRRWFNPFPIKWFSTDKFFKQYNEIWGGGKDTTNARHEAYRIINYITIIRLSNYIKTLTILLKDHNSRQLFSLILKKKAQILNLDFYIKGVKELTGVEVKELSDMDRVQKIAESKLRKYKDIYKTDDPKKAKESISFIEAAQGIFLFLNADYNASMKLFEFEKLVILADKKSKSLQKAKKKK